MRCVIDALLASSAEMILPARADSRSQRPMSR
ncbi:hypothetical protein TSAR_011520 [Trichomalopsis sarcophagae]|uniref:Uncharacterized protein n=1 Tax=Trichomalopsis sarcophagae TaxID=543379 RepID=A0A232FA78_9HYME|nr:hypothetical protein TSAR_011520 [Trichomalopsis sarcophagae]